MSVTVSWDDEEQLVIRYEFEEGWRFTDYFAAGDQALAMIARTDHPVDIIFNLLHPRFPPGVLKEGHKLTQYIPPETLTIAIVGASPLYRKLGSIMGYLFPKYGGIYVYVEHDKQSSNDVTFIIRSFRICLSYS